MCTHKEHVGKFIALLDFLFVCVCVCVFVWKTNRSNWLKRRKISQYGRVGIVWERIVFFLSIFPFEDKKLDRIAAKLFGTAMHFEIHRWWTWRMITSPIVHTLHIVHNTSKHIFNNNVNNVVCWPCNRVSVSMCNLYHLPFAIRHSPFASHSICVYSNLLMRDSHVHIS